MFLEDMQNERQIMRPTLGRHRRIARIPVTRVNPLRRPAEPSSFWKCTCHPRRNLENARMKPKQPLLAAALAFLSLASSALSANLVVNPGFEAPITSDGPPFVGFWEGFNGGAGASAANSSLMPLSGSQSLRLAIVNTDNTFAGVFQDIPGVTPGAGYSFSGSHVTTSSPLDLTVEVRIEWRNSGSNIEVSRTPHLNPVPGQVYSPFDLPVTVPVGADTARL